MLLRVIDAPLPGPGSMLLATVNSTVSGHSIFPETNYCCSYWYELARTHAWAFVF